MKKLPYWMGLLLLAALLLAACTPAAAGPDLFTPVPVETEAPAGPTNAQEAAVEAARQALAGQLGLEVAAIELVNVSSAEFPDSCLGLPLEGEGCAEVITPGFGGAFLLPDDQQWEFRVDESGAIFRFLPGAALSARQALAQLLGLDPDTLQIVRAERVEWANGCLELSRPEMTCIAAVTPGYRLLLQAKGEQYEFRTDLTGGLVLLAEAPQPQPEGVLLEWEFQAEVCTTASFRRDGFVFGLCGAEMTAAPYLLPERAATLQGFTQTYAPFRAETASGEVAFFGQGTQQATPIEQRMIAEWAGMTYWETNDGRASLSNGLAFTWRRTGGIAGFCDDLRVYRSGEVSASSCKGNPPQEVGRGRLTAEEVARLYEWIDQVEPFELDNTDPATADAMTVRLVFSGSGFTEATPAEQAAILEFAEQLWLRLKEQPASGLEAARAALMRYFEALNAQDWDSAQALFAGDIGLLQGYNPGIPADDRAALFEAGCRLNGFVCNLTVREVLEAEQIGPTMYRFLLTFADAQGQPFQSGPCCGADPTAEPPTSQFEYTVVAQEGQYRVQEYPVYVP